MEKLVIRITVYKDIDPELYDSVGHLSLRQRAAVIRRLWREGLRAGSLGMVGPQVADTRRAHSTTGIPMPGLEPAGSQASATYPDSAKALFSDDIADLLKESI